MFRTRVVALAMMFVMIGGASAGAATFRGGPTNDVIAGTSNHDRLFGGRGSDALFGRQGPDVIRSASPLNGEDALVFPGSGRDRVVTAFGNDTVYDDDSFSDVIVTGRGQDLVVSSDGARDTINCGGDVDLAIADELDIVRGCDNVVRRSIGALANVANDIVFGSNVVDTFTMAPGKTWAFGMGGSDVITGSLTQDVILGGPGNDTINGSGGVDTIVDDDGTPGDILSGGSADDTIYSIDGAADSIDCNGDFDVIFVDSVDSLSNCGSAFQTVAQPIGGVQ